MQVLSFLKSNFLTITTAKMEAKELFPVLEQLDDDIDDVEEMIQPLLNRSLAETSKNLPVLDKAKFYVMVTYALENVIFSYLNLRGEDPKAHAVWRELTRLRQYFDKIKTAETRPEQRTMTLDKEAANRFIKHGLAGNDRIDLERKEREAKERAVARRKELELLMNSAKSEQSSKDHSGDSRSDANSGPDEDEDDDSDNDETTVKKSASDPKLVDDPHFEKTERTGKNKGKNKRFKQGKKLDKEGLRKENAERKQKKKKNRKARNGK